MKIRIPLDPNTQVPSDLHRYITVAHSPNQTPTRIENRQIATAALSTPRLLGATEANAATEAANTRRILYRLPPSRRDQRDATAAWHLTVGAKAAKQLTTYTRDAAARDTKAATTKAPKNPDPPALPPDTAPIGHPQHRPNNTPDPRDARASPARVPPYNIRQSAAQAAIWLAQRFPDDVAEIGWTQWLADRTADILEHRWPPRYWQPLNRIDPAAQYSIAFRADDPDWQKPPFNDPFRRRSIITYAAPSAPYPMPPPGQTAPKPYPGFQGDPTDEWLADIYHASWLSLWQFPEPYNVADMAPLYLDTHALYAISADAPPSRIQFAALAQPTIYATDRPGADDAFPLPLFSRRYNWTTKIPPGGTSPYAATMRRHFVLDCRIAALIRPDENDDCTRLRIAMGPAAAWGRYYGRAAEIHTDYTLYEDQAYVARSGPSDPQQILYLQATGAWTLLYPAPPPSKTVILTMRFQPYTAVALDGRTNIPLGTIQFREHKTGHRWPVKQCLSTDPPTPYTFAVAGTYDNAFLATDDQTAYNLRDFGASAGTALLYATAWQDQQGKWRTTPGRLDYYALTRRGALTKDTP